MAHGGGGYVWVGQGALDKMQLLAAIMPPMMMVVKTFVLLNYSLWKFLET